MAEFFQGIAPIKFEGKTSTNPLAFRYYDKDRMVLGKSMDEHLRCAVCYWHTFAWPGCDVFGAGTFDRPWYKGADPIEAAELKLKVAFEFFEKLGAPFYAFHDRDIAPEGATLKESHANLDRVVAGAEREKAAPASSCSGAPPTSSATRATCAARPPIPIRTSSPTPPRR